MTGLPEEVRRSYGHYEVESVLGRGAMGMVYLARDRRIGRKVALKTVQVDQSFDDQSEQAEFFKRLQREAELCGALQHPNIVTLYEPGYENDVISFLATEYIDGESLRHLLKKTRPLPLDQALRISQDLLRGLAFAHEKGIVHRDIKPANILLTASGQAKLADFGIARPKESELTVKGEMLGTPNYMSPEQVKCTPVTPQSDLFSVGVVMYEMLTGAKAFAAGDLSGILRNVVELDPPPAHQVNPSVPEPVARVVARLMAKQPGARYASAADALDDLRGTPSHVVVHHNTQPAAAAPAAAAAEPQTFPPAITDSRFDDRSPTPVPLQTGPLLKRRISPLLFWGLVLVLVGALGVSAWQIRANTDETPTVIIEERQLAEFAEKRRQIGEARALAESGKLEESAAAYSAYIDRWPNAPIAYVERDQVWAAIDARKKSRDTVTVRTTRPSSRSQAQPAQRQKEEEKPGFWRRVFGRGNAKKP